MTSGRFANTSSHMVQEVTNIIDGYKMGPLRALAQEPVQNAMDAMRKGEGTVTVEYRLLHRKTVASGLCYVLTVSDKGTTGLRGPWVDDAELQARNYMLKPDENWAAFEAQGYTKENEDALGSRGQGKSAFLYHSHVPGNTRRMMMLYDTLLADGEYRLGMRFARPVDQRLTPPIRNEKAKQAIQSRAYPIEDNLAIPLGLEPLREIGTRVIVPFLSDEDANSMRPGGELCDWLQRCWWRAIQIGKLQIRVVDDKSGAEETIQPPAWWRHFPRISGKLPEDGIWRDLRDGGRACIWGNLGFGDEYLIRRLVMLHSDAIDEDEIVRDHPEYAGIQIIRGLQWIETRGARQDFGDYIPRDKRPGFRGYVEFDKDTDSKLRAAENSQHDGFDARGKKGEIVRELRIQLAASVREFSEQMGWEQPQAISKQQVSQREQQTHTRFLETFLTPEGRKPKSISSQDGAESSQLRWECRLDLDYPNPKSARVDWGESLGNLYVEVAYEPANELMGSASLLLEWVNASAERQEILRIEDAIRTEWHPNRAYQQFELGDWTILRGKSKPENQQLSCSEPAECKLRAVIEYRGERVKSAARIVYVNTNPPPPPQKNPVTLSISAENISDGDQKRIDHSQVLQLQINARNRMTEADTFNLSTTFCDDILARDSPVELEGTPAGDTPISQAILSAKRRLLDPQRDAQLPLDRIQTQVMPDSSGAYRVRAELTDANGGSVAVASQLVYFQLDPGKAKNKLPFEIRQKRQVAMWELNEELTELTYPGDYPLYKELKNLQRQHRPLQDKLAFIAEISANGLLEWAMRSKDQGDDSRYDQLYDEDRSLDNTQWDDFNRGLENMSKTLDSPIEFAQTWRETVAIMLKIFAKEHD